MQWNRNTKKKPNMLTNHDNICYIFGRQLPHLHHFHNIRRGNARCLWSRAMEPMNSIWKSSKAGQTAYVNKVNKAWVFF